MRMLTPFRFAQGPRMSALTRGPLPARVYWTRRLMVLGTAFLLVFGIARVLTGESDGSSDRVPEAVQAAATPTTAGPTVTATAQPKKQKDREKPKKEKTRKAPVLAQPDGPCTDSDVAVTPTVKDPVAGRTVFMVLELRTVTSAACTWRVSPETVTLKITSGKDDIWSSRQCPRAVPTQTVVVRSAVTTKVGVRWSGRRSDDECSRLTEWALPGWYHVAAAALAGEPSDVQFELERPTREVITREPEPEKDGGKKRHPGRDRDRDEDDQLKHR